MIVPACRKSEKIVACVGKEKFDSADKALKASRRLKVKAYRCPHCSHYHLGGRR